MSEAILRDMDHSDGPAASLVLGVADSADTRLFIELSSYGSDLKEASHALDLAMQGLQGGSPLADASVYLIGFAVIAYCRTFLHSNVRRPLTEHVRVPPELEQVHEQVRTFRNATIAHSQSELSVTYPLGFLDPATLELAHLSGVTISSTLPEHVMDRFRRLVDVMTEQLDVVIEPVRARLEYRLRKTDPHLLLAGPRPELPAKFAEDFNPRSKRAPYPTGQTLYWNHPR
ncbi:hypothetical protein N865_20855 [Intrasporangium oryzae NRRL B-24470]|uniref:Uncharacterized protein n=2 Tax=Intrasporangium TaxID=53357 RepID=W9G7B2_9MICO|nr:hypothetical protein N865_20855 [Intrasporangium oryzae NRRL B-24470]